MTGSGAAETDPSVGLHCDDAIDDPARPQALRDFLRYARLPAVCRLPGVSAEAMPGHLKWIDPDLHAHVWTGPVPELFADLVDGITVVIPAPDWLADRAPKSVVVAAGCRVRVVMASRFGDVGITTDLKSDSGYLTRVPLTALGGFSASRERSDG